MRAILCREFGPPTSLTRSEIDEPELTPGSVKIAVEACGINFPDILMVAGKYQQQPPMPFVPGAEVAGRVSALGDGVTHLNVGDRVGAFTGHGGLAECLVAKAHLVYPLPEALPAELAAAFVLAYGTSYHALNDRAELGKGETLLVLGAAGGVGLAAVQIGAAMGANVIAAASSDEKIELALANGASAGIRYDQENLKDAVREHTNGHGADVIYDPVGGEMTNTALRSIAWGGRLAIIGFAAGDIPALPANLPLLKGASIVGVFWGRHVELEPKKHAANMQALQGMLASGALRPVVQSPYPHARAADALQCLADRRALGKLVVKVSDATGWS